jgi:predicted transcriptional regulator
MALSEVVQALSALQLKVEGLEQAVSEGIREIRQSLCLYEEHRFLLDHGLQGLKAKIAKQTTRKLNTDPRNILYERMRLDKTLRHPHRKILDFLSGLYDELANAFKEVHYSEIVKKCRLAKNMANSYLRFLADKAYISRRDDGYRIWYKVLVG